MDEIGSLLQSQYLKYYIVLSSSLVPAAVWLESSSGSGRIPTGSAASAMIPSVVGSGFASKIMPWMFKEIFKLMSSQLWWCMRVVFVYGLTVKITIIAKFGDSLLWCGGSDLYKET